jgi:hypothetical protein
VQDSHKSFTRKKRRPIKPTPPVAEISETAPAMAEMAAAIRKIVVE